MALTVTKDNKLEISKDVNHKTQHFFIYPENGKFCIVDQKNNTGLCIFQDNQENGAHIISDPNKHTSSLFEIVRADKGPFANRGYLIKTHAANRCLDISGGHAEEGKPVLQYNIHQNGNQVWLIEPLHPVKVKAKFNNWSQ